MGLCTTWYGMLIVGYAIGVLMGGLVVWVLTQLFPGIFPTIGRELDMDANKMEDRIRAYLDRCGGNLNRTAVALNTTKVSLVAMCRGLGIDWEIYVPAKLERRGK